MALRGVAAKSIDETTGSIVAQPDRVRDTHPSGVEPEKLVVLTDPDLIPLRQEPDRTGTHPTQSGTGGDGVLDHIDGEHLVSVSRVRQEDRPAVPEGGQPVVITVTPIGRRKDLDAVHLDVSSVQSEHEREVPPSTKRTVHRDERWRDVPRGGVAFELQAIIGGDPRDSDVGKGVLETSDDHPRQFALSNEGIRFWGVWPVDRLTDEGETTFRPRND
jgi:hypothetical protein